MQAWAQPSEAETQPNALLRPTPVELAPPAMTARDRVIAWLDAQQKISEQRGLWTGGQVWEGGHPTVAGVADAAQQYGDTLLMGTTAPRAVSIHPSGTIVSDGVNVGRVKFEHGDQSTRIANIEVDPSFQNQGIGSDVIRQIQEEAAARGNPVVLTTDAMRGKEAQANQRRLYERLGFTPNRGADAVSERIGKRRVTEELVWRPPPPDPQ